MTLSRRSTIRAIGVVGAGSALTGTALAVNEHQDSGQEPSADEVGSIRVGHFAPDAPNVDVYVDDQQILSDFSYGTLSPYLGIEPGTYTVSITPAGEAEPVLEETVPVDTGYYTVAAIGELEGDETGDDSGDGVGAANETAQANATNETAGDGADPSLGDESDTETEGLQFLVLADRGPDDVQEGTALVRVVHASPDAPTVDIAESTNDTTVFEDVAFTEPSGYAPVDPETEALGFFPAEDSSDDELDDDEVISQSDPVVTVELDLEAGQAYTAYAIGYLEGEEGVEIDAADGDEADESESGDDRSFDVYVALDGTTEATQSDDRAASSSDAGNESATETDDRNASDDGYGEQSPADD